MGGLAVSQESYANEGERGYIALMGPGFSVLITAILLWLAYSNPNQPLLAHAAYISALLNGFNLLPILPLDGGNVTGALLSRTFGLREKVQMATLVAAIGLCSMLQFWLGAFIALSVLISMQQHGDPAVSLMPISKKQRNWLAIAYAATIAFYIFAAISAKQVRFSFVPPDQYQRSSQPLAEADLNNQPYQDRSSSTDTRTTEDDLSTLRCENDERLVISRSNRNGVRCVKD